MAYTRLLLLLVLGLFQYGTCYKTFQNNIPNGESVPSPCNPNHMWQGVGHLAKSGGGERNLFGKDFHAEGYVWTQQLCNLDSDGDGKTNGEELGDPNCIWTKGTMPEITIGLSHPGFCDNEDSLQCRESNRDLDCSTDEFSCDALSDPDIKSYIVSMDETPVPAAETTYMCQVMDIPKDRDYHLVAAEPYIQNVDVMHHIIVYGCKDDASVTPEMLSPYQCFMNRVEGCEEILAIWAVGSNGICYHEDAGFKLGKSGFKQILLEMHWNNPMLVDTFRDSSGLTLHMTPNLRKYDAGMLMIGQTKLVIPPGRDMYTTNSTCSSECTSKKMSGNIYITGSLNHMHYLGKSAVSKMITDDNEEHILADDPKYSYDSPMFYVFDEPIEMEPGYELTLQCDFKSTSRSKTTFFGEATNDEMCFAFLMYYPKENWMGQDCVSVGTIDSCEYEANYGDGCDFGKLGDPTDPENVQRYTLLQENCRLGMCLEECKEVLREIFKHPCFAPGIYDTFKSMTLSTEDQAYKTTLYEYYYRLDSCAAELEKEKCHGHGDDGWAKPEISGAQGVVLSSTLAMMIGSFLFSFQ